VKSKIIAFDLDEVLCTRDEKQKDPIKKYYSCMPIKKMIKVCNELYNSGNRIIIYTARGMTTQKGNTNDVYSKLYNLTLNQINTWGIMYHQLVMGKIHYDLLIDDKAINSTTVESVSSIEEFFGEKK